MPSRLEQPLVQDELLTINFDVTMLDVACSHLTVGLRVHFLKPSMSVACRYSHVFFEFLRATRPTEQESK